MQPADAEGEIRILGGRGAHVEYDCGVEEVSRVQFVRGRVAEMEMRRRRRVQLDRRVEEGTPARCSRPRG